MATGIEALADRLVPWLIRKRRAVLSAALALGLVAACFAARLYGDLRSEVEELLPANAPSVLAARSIGPKLHSVSHLSIVLEGKDPLALERFADALAAKLRALPPEQVESVSYRVDEEKNFVQSFGLFYFSKEDLTTLLGRIEKRVAWEKQHANPLLHLTEADTSVAPPLAFEDFVAKYGGKGADLDHYRNGYFQTPEGHLLALLVRPPELGTGYAFNERLMETVRQTVSALGPTRFDPSMKVGYDGEVASVLEEQESLVKDLVSSTAIVLVLVFAALYFFFRDRAAIMAVVGSLAMGCALTFGLSDLLVGHLNANTAFLGSIVIGNGINVAIILMARFQEEMRRGETAEEAILVAWKSTLSATFMAAFSAGLAYLCLAVTDFRGFSQFGLIGGMGMALCWTTAYLLLPPLVVALKGHRRPKPQTSPHGISGWVARQVEGNRGAIQVLTVLLVLGALLALGRYKGSLIESDMTNLRSEKSHRNGALFWGAKVDEVFRSYLTPVVVMGDTREDLDKVVATLSQMRRALGAADPLREVQTLDTALPPDVADKVELVARIRANLSEARMRRFDAPTRARVEQLRPPAQVRAPTLQDLPHTVRLSLTERDGTAGRVALAFPSSVGTMTAADLDRISHLIRGAIARSGAHAQALSQQLLFEDISTAIIQDGPKTTLLALFAVCGLVFAVFRRAKPALLTCAGLLLGVLLLIGVAAAFQVRINFLNFVVLPITFGIGVDYAVNIIYRYRSEGRSALMRILRETGGAVALCSSTTIIGYASLLVADSRALKGFGLLASLGELTCVLTALVLLPAWLLPRAGRSKKPELGTPRPESTPFPIADANSALRIAGSGAWPSRADGSEA